MQLSNQIILRPRFKIDVNINNEKLLDCFEDSKNKQSEFIVNRLDEHVFIKLTKIQRHFWSPQLHLEINETTKKKSTINGLFGPNPEVWTMFMFLHFVTASLFIGFGIWNLYQFNLE